MVYVQTLSKQSEVTPEATESNSVGAAACVLHFDGAGNQWRPTHHTASCITVTIQCGFSLLAADVAGWRLVFVIGLT